MPFTLDPDKGGEYPSWLYEYAADATGGVRGFDAVTAGDIAQFHEQGYLIVRDAFTQAEVAAALDGLVDLIDGKNPEFRDLQFENAAAAKLDQLTAEEKQDAIRKLFYMASYDNRLWSLTKHSKLMSVLKRMIGSDELKMFQDMALLKPPRIGREKPWHQDMAYFNLPLETTVVGVWIALDEATADNGCMMVIPGSHKKGAQIHFRRRDWQICDTDVARGVALSVPLKPGSCLLFHGLIHHGTPANRTDQRRRALQYHYCSAHVEEMPTAYRLEHFGSEGKDVEC